MRRKGVGVGKVANIIGSGLGPWRSRVIFLLNGSFLLKLLYSFQLGTAKLIGYYFYNRYNARRMFDALPLFTFLSLQYQKTGAT